MCTISKPFEVFYITLAIVLIAIPAGVVISILLDKIHDWYLNYKYKARKQKELEQAQLQRKALEAKYKHGKEILQQYSEDK